MLAAELDDMGAIALLPSGWPPVAGVTQLELADPLPLATSPALAMTTTWLRSIAQ